MARDKRMTKTRNELFDKIVKGIETAETRGYTKTWDIALCVLHKVKPIKAVI